MNNTKFNYSKLFSFIFIAALIYGGYNLFIYLSKAITISGEVDYLSQLNKNYFYGQNIFEKSDNDFERTLNKSESNFNVSYSNVSENFCESMLESIQLEEQIWTNITFQNNDKKSSIFMEDINDESIDFMCNDNLNMSFIINKESDQYQEVIKKRKNNEELTKLKDENTKELEFIFTNIYNFQDNRTAVDSNFNPYDRIFGFLVQNNSNKIEDRKKMIITYQPMPVELCKRFIDIAYNRESDEFHQKSIITFNRDRLNVLINGEDISDLRIYYAEQLCFKDVVVRIEAEV